MGKFNLQAFGLQNDTNFTCTNFLNLNDMPTANSILLFYKNKNTFFFLQSCRTGWLVLVLYFKIQIPQPRFIDGLIVMRGDN
jgi:hypothetical protein